MKKIVDIKELFFSFLFCKVAWFSFQKETFVCLPHVRVGTNEKENLICATQRVRPDDELFSLLHAFPHFLNVNFFSNLKEKFAVGNSEPHRVKILENLQEIWN